MENGELRQQVEKLTSKVGSLETVLSCSKSLPEIDSCLTRIIEKLTDVDTIVSADHSNQVSQAISLVESSEGSSSASVKHEELEETKTDNKNADAVEDCYTGGIVGDDGMSDVFNEDAANYLQCETSANKCSSSSKLHDLYASAVVQSDEDDNTSLYEKQSSSRITSQTDEVSDEDHAGSVWKAKKPIQMSNGSQNLKKSVSLESKPAQPTSSEHKFASKLKDRANITQPPKQNALQPSPQSLVSNKSQILEKTVSLNSQLAQSVSSGNKFASKSKDKAAVLQPPKPINTPQPSPQLLDNEKEDMKDLGYGVSVNEKALKSCRHDVFTKLVNNMMSMLFTDAELTNCSRTGKRAKSAEPMIGEENKKRLDPNRLQAIKDYTLKTHGASEENEELFKKTVSNKCKNTAKSYRGKKTSDDSEEMKKADD